MVAETKTTPLDANQERKRDALSQRLFRTLLDALDIWGVYLGHHLGYYAVLSTSGALTASELAARSSTAERHTREWLEQQAATGILTVESGTCASSRRYALDAGHASVLSDEDSLSYMVPLVRYYVATGLLIPRVLEAFRTGGGIPWTEMGKEIREAQEGFNRVLFLKRLGAENLPSLPAIHARLIAEPPARFADVGCGAGWSSIAIARAYPKARVDGFDFDPEAVEAARRNAAEAGVGDRVRFHVRKAEEPEGAQYDVVGFFECLHDLAHPVEALSVARELLAPGGCVLVMDERVDEEFRAPAGDVDRMMYGWSIVQCLLGAMAEHHAEGTGAVMRPSTVRSYAERAGFRKVTVLPIDNDPIRRWYELVP